MFLDSFRFCLVFLMFTFLNACGGTEVSHEQPPFVIVVQPPIVSIGAPSTPPAVLSFAWPEASAQSQGMSEQKLERRQRLRLCVTEHMGRPFWLYVTARLFLRDIEVFLI